MENHSRRVGLPIRCGPLHHHACRREVRPLLERGRRDPKPQIKKLAVDLGVHPEALRGWIRQAEADAGERDNRLTIDEWPSWWHCAGRTPSTSG
ncbi:transposase [Streptomyces sp. NPDC088847]|uniref:transposase n=1 Tax=Streptomyces sp. NPDC088847 TaxID=3365909 RepID=UPI003816A8D6